MQHALLRRLPACFVPFLSQYLPILDQRSPKCFLFFFEETDDFVLISLSSDSGVGFMMLRSRSSVQVLVSADLYTAQKKIGIFHTNLFSNFLLQCFISDIAQYPLHTSTPNLPVDGEGKLLTCCQLVAHLLRGKWFFVMCG